MPGRASGASTAWKRVPSGSRRSTYGVASSSRRPAGPASRCASRRTAASSANRVAGQLEALAPVDVDRIGPVDEHVGDTGQPEQRLERAGAQHVLAEQVVHGQHRRVADRAALVAQRAGDHLRCQRRAAAGELLAHRRRRRRAGSGSTGPQPSRHAPRLGRAASATAGGPGQRRAAGVHRARGRDRRARRAGAGCGTRPTSGRPRTSATCSAGTAAPRLADHHARAGR